MSKSEIVNANYCSLRTHLEGLLEGGPEVAIEVRINNGVQGRVEVADPEQDAHQEAGRDAAIAQRGHDVPGIKKNVKKVFNP